MGIAEDYRRQYNLSTEALLSELKSATGREIEIHPCFGPPQQEVDSLYTGHKLHHKNSRESRTLILLIGEFEYVQDAHGNWSFTPQAYEPIKREIESFWDGRNTTRLWVRYIPAKQ
jgi:hypothetical protein